MKNFLLITATLIVSAIGGADETSTCARHDKKVENAFNGPGAILLVVGALYSLWCLAFVVEEFFVPALEIFCRKNKIPDSVAGSLVMAAGNDAPEICVSFIGIFIEKSAIGMGTVIGSEVFNHMLISAGCAYYSKHNDGFLELDPRGFTRDCLGYGFSLIVLMWAVGADVGNTFIVNNWTTCLKVNVVSSVVLLLGQILYTAFVAKYDSICDYLLGDQVKKPVNSFDSVDPTISTISNNPIHGDDQAVELNRLADSKHAPNNMTNSSDGEEEFEYSESFCISSAELDEAAHHHHTATSDFEENLSVFLYYSLLPFRYAIEWTIPDVRSDEWTRYYGLSAFVSVVWLILLSYSLLFCLSELGAVMGIPAVVMGFTFSAVGTSFPNLWSSLVVAKIGRGNMAISNALGSNTLNIFVALGAPFFVYTCIYGQYNSLQDNGIIILLTLLLLLLVAYYVVIWFHDFKIYSWMGNYMSITYVLFLLIAISIDR